MKLPEGLVMKQTPNGKIALQMSGKTDYKVSMVGTPDGSFQLKFDKPQQKQPPKPPPAKGPQIVNILPPSPATDKRKIPFVKATPIRAPFLLQNTPGGKIVQATVASPTTGAQLVPTTGTQLVQTTVASPVQTRMASPVRPSPRIGSVGKIVSLPEGQQVFVSEGSASARIQNRSNRAPTQAKPTEEKKSRPNILSRSNRRKSTPRKVQSIQPTASTGKLIFCRL